MLFVGFKAVVSNSPTAAISYRIWYGFYLIFLMKELQEKTLTWNYYIFTTWWSYFSKTWTQTLSAGTVPTERVKLSVLALSFTLEFLHPHVPTASFHILMSSSIIETCGDSFSFLRVPLSQNECFMKVKLSVFGLTELVLLHHHVPHVNNQYKTSLQDVKILAMLLCFRKIYWPTWN